MKPSLLPIDPQDRAIPTAPSSAIESSVIHSITSWRRHRRLTAAAELFECRWHSRKAIDGLESTKDKDLMTYEGSTRK